MITEDVREELALLTPDEVCELLRVSKGWLYDQVQKHGFPHIRVGKYLRFRPSEVDQWVTNGPPKVEPLKPTRPKGGRPRK